MYFARIRNIDEVQMRNGVTLRAEIGVIRICVRLEKDPPVYSIGIGSEIWSEMEIFYNLSI